MKDIQHILRKATPQEAEMLDAKINVFNAQSLRFSGTLEESVAYVIEDDVRNMMAGISGVFYLEEILYIHILFVKEAFHKQGFGVTLLQTLEKDAQSRGIKLIHLDTFDFQAKDFYLKYGYEVFGVLDDCPQGHKRYYMKKVL